MQIIEPIFRVNDRQSFERELNSERAFSNRENENALADSSTSDNFSVTGFCNCCNKVSRFEVDLLWGGAIKDGKRRPNWRERLVCPTCGMNNRQRLVATLALQATNSRPNEGVYFMEQVTPIFRWVVAHLNTKQIYGSEYLGHDYKGGSSINGIRHEDIMSLSFDDEELTYIFSNDVFEHVPNPKKAFFECYRVLRHGGEMIATFPFHYLQDNTVLRATIEDGKVQSLLNPVFHGNPVSKEGSLVFSDFGWDIFAIFKECGFSSALLEGYFSNDFGHIGGAQLVFRLIK
jgi:SAM-dependent methyltransferase